MENKQVSQKNIGISLLRIWMSFEVVLEHFKIWNYELINQTSKVHIAICHFLEFYMFIAVPCFMIMAFMFTDIELIANDKEKLKQRFSRLIIPHVFWAVFYLLVYVILDAVCKTNFIKYKTDFFWQLFFGHAYNRTLWFQFDLIVITAFYVTIFKFFKKEHAIIFIQFLAVFAIWAQYSKANGYLFFRIIKLHYYPQTYIMEPFGRLLEMIPYASIGVLIKFYDLFGKISSFSTKRNIARIFLALIVVFITRCYPLFQTPTGFVYQGLQKIIIGFCLVFVFYRIHYLLKLYKCKVFFWGGELYCPLFYGNIFFSKSCCKSAVYNRNKQFSENE